MMKMQVQSLILGICLLLPFAVRASCNFIPGNVTATIPANINVANVAIGDALATIIANYTVNCPVESGMGTQEWVLYPQNNADYGASPVSEVRNTAYQGIGIKWISRNTTIPGGTSITRTTASINNNTGNQLGVAKGSVTAIEEEFTLVKTDAISAGQLPAMTFIISSRGSGGYSPGGTVTITLTQSSIQTVSCSVVNNMINVNMGTISTSAFNGIGSTASSTQFRIPVECDGNTPLSFTINGSSSDPQNGLLTLGSGSTVSGVGIQILYQDVPLRLSSAQSLGTVSSGSFDIPLIARYYQIGSTVTAGTVNATATVTFTYN